MDLAMRREPFLRRARECAALTIPSILPPTGHQYHNTLPEPDDGLGSRAVIYLSSRLMTALLPAGSPFFKLGLPTEVLAQNEMKPDQEMERLLTLAELHIMSEVERRNWRTPTNLTLQLLIVTGNALEYMAPDNTLKVFRLDQYVVDRDLAGNPIEVIVLNRLAPSAVPERARGLIAPRKYSATDQVELYTHAKLLPNGKWRVHQELNDNTVPGSIQTLNRCPFMVYRWSVVPGEAYGRSKVEEHIADLRALNHLRKCVKDGSALQARHVILIRPNATGNRLRRFIEEARNGDVGIGNPEDVNLVSYAQAANGLQVAAAQVNDLVQSLSTAFLLGSGLRRDAERVTATELRMVTEELDGTLGGVFSMLSADMQRERIVRLIENMERNQQLPMMSDVVDPQIITGLEALSRQQDVYRIQTAMQVTQALSPEERDYLKTDDFLKVLFNGLGLPAMVRSEDEVAQLRQERAIQQAIARIAQPDQLAALSPDIPDALTGGIAPGAGAPPAG